MMGNHTGYVYVDDSPKSSVLLLSLTQYSFEVYKLQSQQDVCMYVCMILARLQQVLLVRQAELRLDFVLYQLHAATQITGNTRMTWIPENCECISSFNEI